MDHSKLTPDEKSQLVALHQKAGDSEFNLPDADEAQIQELATAVNALADIVPIIAQKLEDLQGQCDSFYSHYKDAYNTHQRGVGISCLHEKLKGMDGYGDLEKFYSESEGGDFKTELFDLMDEAKSAAAKAAEGKDGASPFDEDGFIKSALDAVRGKIDAAKNFGSKPDAAVVETKTIEAKPLDSEEIMAQEEKAAADEGSSIGAAAKEAKALKAAKSSKK